MIKADQVGRAAEKMCATLGMLGQTQRALIPYGPEIKAERFHEHLRELIDAVRSASAELQRAHNRWVTAKRAIEKHRRSSCDRSDPASRWDAMQVDDDLRLAVERASRARAAAIGEVQRIVSALSDGTAQARSVRTSTARDVLDIVSARIRDDVPVDLYGILLRLTTDPEEQSVIYQFLVTLSDLPKDERHRSAIRGLRSLSRSPITSRLARFFRRGRESESLFRAIARDDD